MKEIQEVVGKLSCEQKPVASGSASGSGAGSGKRSGTKT